MYAIVSPFLRFTATPGRGAVYPLGRNHANTREKGRPAAGGEGSQSQPASLALCYSATDARWTQCPPRSQCQTLRRYVRTTVRKSYTSARRERSFHTSRPGLGHENNKKKDPKKAIYILKLLFRLQPPKTRRQRFEKMHVEVDGRVEALQEAARCRSLQIQ